MTFYMRHFYAVRARAFLMAIDTVLYIDSNKFQVDFEGYRTGISTEAF